ncbi:MAG: hypothetical protein JSS98_03635 [Bacteroidetes bacterium]|nr:hypothetical protein [Bacteroidota bacterium]
MKNIFRPFITLIFLPFILLFTSCSHPCIEPRGIEGAGLTISFFNTFTNEYFYPENTALSPYNIDSLRVKDSNGKQLRTPYQLNSDPINPLKKFQVVEIYPIFIPTDDYAAYENELTKYIYIRYNYETFDTLKVVYKAKKEKCINNFEYIKVFYKNVLLSENFNRPEPLVFLLNHKQ